MIAHIGYHKTATTFLQKEVFPHLKGVTYYDYRHCDALFRPVCHDTTLEFEAEKIQTRLDRGMKVLYSYEGLTGTMGTGVYNAEIAQRLKALSFRKIIVGIRRQDRMLESIYRQHIQQGGVVGPAEYLKEPQYFNPAYLDYYKLIKYYTEIFGRENVLILLQEELSEKPEEVISSIADFCGAERPEMGKKTDGNVSLSRLSIRMLRVINHFTYNNFKRSQFIWKGMSTKNFRYLFQKYLDPYMIRPIAGNAPFYSKVTREQTLRRYRESNSKLDEFCNGKLLKYAYY